MCHEAAQYLAARRRYDLLHADKPYHDGTETSWAAEPSLSHPFKYDDGVRIWLSRVDETPDDDFLKQSVAQQPSGEVGEPADDADG